METKDLDVNETCGKQAETELLSIFKISFFLGF